MLATRDAALTATPAPTAAGQRHYVVSATGVHYLVLGTDGATGVFAVSERTGQVVHAVARRVSRRRPTCALVTIAYGEDTGDAAGTLAFDPAALSTPGYTPLDALAPAWAESF
jgi:hypothetical protein